MRKAYDDVAEQLLPWAKKTMSAHLIKLAKEGAAELESAQWRAP